MQEIRRSFLWLALAWGAAVALLVADAVIARAQSESRSTAIEEIVVTAQRREELLQRAPLSVTALSGDFLNETNFQNIDDIEQFVPNLHMHTNVGGNTGTTVNIRGAITGDPIITFEPSVGLYVDNLYISKTVGSLFDAPDLERIEVLRGPQGTLYGRNTIGGAINLIRVKPQEDPFASVRLGAGNFDSFNTTVILDSGMYDIGPTENLGRFGMRGNLQYRVRDPFYDNRPINGFGINEDGTSDLGSSGFDELDRVTGRVSARWQLPDRLTVDYAFDWFRSREVTTAFQLSGIRDNIPGGPRPTSTVDFLSSIGLLPDARQFIRTSRANEIGNNRVRRFASFLPDRPGPENIALANPLDVRSHLITAELEIGSPGPFEDLKLISISGWRSVNQQENQDLDGTPLHITDFGLTIDQKQFSEELQLQGKGFDGIADFVFGLYYFEEGGGEDNPQIIFADQPIARTAFDSQNRFDNWSLAPFTQITIRPPILDERLALTGGIRYTYEKKDAFRHFQCLTPQTLGDQCLGFEGSADTSFETWTPMGNVAFDFTDDVMGYFLFSQGVKSGGFNGRAPLFDRHDALDRGFTNPDGSVREDLPFFVEPFTKERMTSYEVGFKTQWFEDRLQVNTAGFRNKIDNNQVSNFVADPQIGAVTYVLTSDLLIWGAEVEAVVIPVAGLHLRTAYSLLRPEYTRLNLPQADGSIADLRREGAFANSPEHTISLGAAYTAPETRAGLFTVAVNAYWQDHEDYLLFNNDFINQGDYWLLGGRMQLAEIPGPYGSFDLVVWGRNLLDQSYRTFGIDFNTLGFAGNIYGQPRTFGFDVIWRWGGTIVRG